MAGWEYSLTSSLAAVAGSTLESLLELEKDLTAECPISDPTPIPTPHNNPCIKEGGLDIIVGVYVGMLDPIVDFGGAVVVGGAFD